INFMELNFDRFDDRRAYKDACLAWAKEARRVLKPGHYVTAFGAPRTYHLLASALEDAGLEIRDQIMWLHSQGMPKAKGLLKPAHEPIVLARKPGPTLKLRVDELRIEGEGQPSRLPNNVLIDDKIAQDLDMRTGILKSGARRAGVR